jgi:hypothetical protein
MVCLPCTVLNRVLSISIMLLLGVSSLPQAQSHVWPNPFYFEYTDFDGFPNGYYGSPVANGQAVGPPNPPVVFVDGLDPDGQLVFVGGNYGVFAYSQTVTATLTSVSVSDPIAQEPWVWGAPPGSGGVNWTLDVGPYSISYAYSAGGFPAWDPSTGLLPLGGAFWVTRFKVTDYSAHLSGWQNMIAMPGCENNYKTYRWVDGPPVHFYVSRAEESFPYTITGISYFVFNQPLKLKNRDRLLAAHRRETFCTKTEEVHMGCCLHRR